MIPKEILWDQIIIFDIVIYYRCPHLVREYSLVIAVLNGIITLFVFVMFARTTFTDPGIYPRGKKMIFENLVPT